MQWDPENQVMQDSLPYEDYRSSHEGKGPDYHAKFFQYPHRSVAWEIEQRLLLNILAARFPAPEQVRLLDFACGTGRILGLLDRRVGTATGVDAADSTLQAAREALSHSELLLRDITQPSDFDSRRFDLITAFRFFPNAEPELREAALEKLAALLAPGGILVFNNHLRCSGTTMRVRRLLQRFGHRFRGRALHCMSDTEAEHLLERHGLSTVETHHLGVAPVLNEKRAFLPYSLLARLEHWATDAKGLDKLCNSKIYLVRPSRA